MTQTVVQPDCGADSLLVQRLEALAVCGATVYPDGRIEPMTNVTRFEQKLLDAAPLRGEIRRRWPQLVEHIGSVLRLWPGLSLAPLRWDRRRRLGGDGDAPLRAAVLLSDELHTAEPLRAVCDHAGLDFEATLAGLDPQRLAAERDVPRLTRAIHAMCGDAVELAKRKRELASLSGELSHSYEELSLLYKLSSGMTMSRKPADFLNEACQELQIVSGMRWTALVLIEDEPRLGELSGRAFSAGKPHVDLDSLEAQGRQLMQKLIDTDAPRVFDDPRRSGLAGLDRLADNLLAVPLHGDGSRLGILLAGDKLDGTAITSVDSKLCDSLASTLAIFLRNTILFADTQSMFLGALRALTAAIDAKDSYTHGHSERVALLARMLAHAAGHDAATCERVFLSGLVHDVGKIGVPEAVLAKPGRLNEQEFEQIKKHPEIGAHILQDIRQMQDLIPGVLYHHERWDGRGYPHGVAGRDIPLFGRLIGLADAFDAMSSNRTYRSGMSRREVLSEVIRCRGSQFDPELADLFVRLDFTAFDRAIEKHHRRERLTPAADGGKERAA